jgi:peptidoglycan/LPS O-acetylase OafA/YrhL
LEVSWPSGLVRVATYGVGAAFLISGILSAELRGAMFPQWSVYFGGMSYSFYLWHVLLFSWCAAFLYSEKIPGLLQWLLWLVIAIVFSVGSYELIEKPVLRIRRRRDTRADIEQASVVTRKRST